MTRLLSRENNPNWKGDELYQRTCLICGSNQTYLDKPKEEEDSRPNGRPIWHKNIRMVLFVLNVMK
jgi:hypothetical protein